MKGVRHKDHGQQEKSNVDGVPNENTTDHQRNRLNENRIKILYFLLIVS